MAQLWGGRFTKETDKLVYNFNASIGFDQKFFHQDVQGSKAHVTMLAKQGILTEDEKSVLFQNESGPGPAADSTRTVPPPGAVESQAGTESAFPFSPEFKLQETSRTASTSPYGVSKLTDTFVSCKTGCISVPLFRNSYSSVHSSTFHRMPLAW